MLRTMAPDPAHTNLERVDVHQRRSRPSSSVTSPASHRSRSNVAGRSSTAVRVSPAARAEHCSRRMPCASRVHTCASRWLLRARCAHAAARRASTSGRSAPNASSRSRMVIGTTGGTERATVVCDGLSSSSSSMAPQANRLRRCPTAWRPSAYVATTCVHSGSRLYTPPVRVCCSGDGLILTSSDLAGLISWVTRAASACTHFVRADIANRRSTTGSSRPSARSTSARYSATCSSSHCAGAQA
ncbi:MAG: hypothetical protein RL238_247 [Actinomycetota bacterium]